jgi:endoplasmic reticulum-Golgi intermediate compartment protein 3
MNILQVVPTLYRYLNGTTIETNQYSVTEHMRHVTPGSGRGLPGVFFFYQVSPLHVEIEEYRRGWIQFFTSVCAVVGGVVTVMGMLDQYVYSRGAAGRQLLR